MQKFYKNLYHIWIISSFVICGLIVIRLYPNYSNNEFPLYTDFTLILFLPAFFIISQLILHIFSFKLSNKRIVSENSILLMKFCFILISFIVSLMFMEFSLGMRIIFSLTSFIISIPHLVITNMIYNKALKN